MKRIIVEGMDATGKTTLINELVSRFHNLEIIVNERGPEQNFNYWLPAILWDRDPTGLIPIHDRFFYSELVYGKVLRGHTNIALSIEGVVRDTIREQALLIYSRPPVDIIRSSLGDNREQMNGVRETWSELLSEYDRVMAVEQDYYKERYVIWNWYMDSSEDIAKKVERYLDG